MLGPAHPGAVRVRDPEVMTSGWAPDPSSGGILFPPLPDTRGPRQESSRAT